MLTRRNFIKRCRLFVAVNPSCPNHYDERYGASQRARAATETDPVVTLAAQRAGLTTETLYLRELGNVKAQGQFLLIFGPGLHDFDASMTYWDRVMRPATAEDIQMLGDLIDRDSQRRPVVLEWAEKPLASHPWLLQHCGPLPPVDTELARAQRLREEAAAIEAEIASRSETETTWAGLGATGAIAEFTDQALQAAARAAMSVAPNTALPVAGVKPNTRIGPLF